MVVVATVCGCRQSDPVALPASGESTKKTFQDRQSLSEQEAIASHRRMVKTLAEIADSFERESANFNPSVLGKLKQQLQAATQNRDVFSVI